MKMFKTLALALIGMFGLSLAQFRGSVSTSELLKATPPSDKTGHVILPNELLALKLTYGKMGKYVADGCSCISTNTCPAGQMFAIITDINTQLDHWAVCDGMDLVTSKSLPVLTSVSYYVDSATNYATSIKSTVPLPTSSPTFKPTTKPTLGLDGGRDGGHGGGQTTRSSKATLIRS